MSNARALEAQQRRAQQTARRADVVGGIQRLPRAPFPCLRLLQGVLRGQALGPLERVAARGFDEDVDDVRRQRREQRNQREHDREI